MTARRNPRHSPSVRVLHWLTAALVFTTLLLGFYAVNSLGDYARLLVVHRTLGVVVLVVVIVRIANRVVHRAPPLPLTVRRPEKVLVLISETGMYLLLLAQPLVGWAMVSASGAPVVVAGNLRLTPIAPADADLYALLRDTHSVLAYALVVTIAAHVSAVLLHTLVVRDRMLGRMSFGR
jgi:cytochrome b561